MSTDPSEIITILASFSSEFTRPTWKNIQTLFVGAILCRGARRITSILRVMELCNERNFSKYHRVLSRSAWSELALSKILLGLLIKIVPESWPILIAVDETQETTSWYEKYGELTFADVLVSIRRAIWA